MTLKYIYFPEMGVRGPEIGMLIMMDGDPEMPFVKDRKGGWYREDARREPDGCFDMCWSTRTVNSLLKKGWVVAAGRYDERGNILSVKRSDREGYPA